jgi:hypothetical protein
MARRYKCRDQIEDRFVVLEKRGHQGGFAGMRVIAAGDCRLAGSLWPIRREAREHNTAEPSDELMKRYRLRDLLVGPPPPAPIVLDRFELAARPFQKRRRVVLAAAVRAIRR